MILFQKITPVRSTMLNRIFILIAIVFTVKLSFGQTSLDRIVAIIGDEIILYSEVESQVKQARQEGVALGENAYCTILEEIMFQKLLVHQAEVDSIEVKEEQVESELDSRINYFISQIGSKEKFEEYYGKSTEKFKDDFREIIRDRMKAQQMQGKITGDIKITPKDVRDFFNSIPKDSIPFIGSKVEVAQLVKIPKVPTDEKLKIKEKLNLIRAEILAGQESFCSAALFNSEDPGTRSNCGEFEFVSRGQFVPEFDAMAFSMKEGELSEVFETQYGYHILQLLERRGDMYRGRHILIMPKVTNEQMAKAAQELDSLYKEIVAGKISFEKAAEKYSDDAETKNNGGKIFNPQSGDTKFEMRELDRQLFVSVDRMNVGDVSEPVFMTTSDQKQGIRLVRLNSRTDPHVANLNDDYPQISEAALADKKNKAILKWVRTKTTSMYVWIDEAYVSCPYNYEWVKKNN